MAAAVVWRRLEHSASTPELNLAIDEMLVHAKAAGEIPTTLRLWHNPPCIVIGVSQNPFVEVNLDACQELGIPVVRRQSGGGAVYHDAGNVNYSLVIDEAMLGRNTSTKRSYAMLLDGVIGALRHFDIVAHQRNISDVYVGERKIAGCAQYRTRGAILHHGCVLIDSDLSLLERTLRVPEAWYREVVNLAELVAPAPSMVEVMDAFADAFAGLFGATIELGSLSDEELANAERLRVEKYDNSDWHFHVSPGWRPGMYHPR